MTEPRGTPYDYKVSEHYDPDLMGLEGAALEAVLDTRCRCGHRRRDHVAATGALGSFGGSACEECWSCGTFVKAESSG